VNERTVLYKLVLRKSFEIDLIEIVLCGSSPGFSFYCAKREEEGGERGQERERERERGVRNTREGRTKERERTRGRKGE
jgi:hypothetical protein